MNFGLLCDDPAAAALVSALRNHPQHRLARAVLVSTAADALLHGMTGAICTDRWEDLLTDPNLDAVIVGGPSPEVWDGAKQLAAAATPLLVFPTVAGGAAALYELSLIRDDQQGVLFPAWSHRFDSSVLALKEAWHAATGPKFSYGQWETEVPLGSGAEVPRAVIEETLFRDADLWRLLCGAPDQVTALRTGGTATGALIQSVVLAGRSQPELTWSIKAGPESKSQLTIHTNQGPLSISPSKPAVGDGGTAQLLDAFESAVREKKSPAEWIDVLHAAEIVDAAERSLVRRRTIELHHETLSERAIFKTQMAAMGCGVLMATLLLMLGYLAIASFVPLDPRLLQWLRLIIFAPLFVFLSMQLLLPLTRTSGGSRETRS